MTGITILLTDCVVKKRVTVKFCQTRGKHETVSFLGQLILKKQSGTR